MAQGTPSEAARRLRLALAAADGAVSVDALVGAGLWRPAELWDLLGRAREEGVVRADDDAGAGHFRWADPKRRADVIATATPADLSALLARPPFPDLVLRGAREAARAGDFRSAAALYRALAGAPDRALFEGGDATWVGA